MKTLIPAAAAALLLALPLNAQPPADAADPAAAFRQAFAEYKEAIREFEKLRSEYPGADQARRDAIDALLRGQYQTMKAKVDEMVKTALDAYRAAPNTDEEVTNLLVSVAEHDTLSDNYERALEIISALSEGDQIKPHPRLAAWGLLAAFATNQFDQAETYMQLAIQLGVFEKEPGRGPAGEALTQAIQYAQDIDARRAVWAKEEKVRQAEAAADDLPRVKLTTTKGEIVLEMFENEAPQAVANFITLVKQGFYSDVVFHRVLPRFMAQGGDPTGSGSGGPGYCIRCECEQPNARPHFRGSLSMAHAGQDTGGSQFFLTFTPTSFLDGRHTVFGRVIDGWGVLAEIQRIDPERPQAVKPDKILSAEVLRDRGHGYEFEKLPGR